jgi:hypothetical protein
MIDTVRFEARETVIESDAKRADIACFAGFVARRSDPSDVSRWSEIPAPTKRWLQSGRYLPGEGTAPLDIGRDPLLDMPVPIDSWQSFDRLFAWDQRTLDEAGVVGPTYFGVAVRSFFAQGGAKCYVIRMGDPWVLADPAMIAASEQERRDIVWQRLSLLLPGFPGVIQGSPGDRTGAHGIGHLFALPDVAFLCLPDLPDIVSKQPDPVAYPPLAVRVEAEEVFVEWSEGINAAIVTTRQSVAHAPRCDDAGYKVWAQALSRVGEFLRVQGPLRVVQFVAPVPMPVIGSSADPNPAALFFGDDFRDNSWLRVESAFVQVVYPWVKTPWTAGLADDIGPPDGCLTGCLASNALSIGTFRSVANTVVGDIIETVPALADHVMAEPVGNNADLAFWQRVTLIGPTVRGFEVLSDVTTSSDESYRPAQCNRLVSAIVRAARALSEELLFEPNGERLWMRITDRLTAVLTAMWQRGAFNGTTPGRAFTVRCDRSTISDNDLDNGRAVAEIIFSAPASIESIAIRLGISDTGVELLQ